MALRALLKHLKQDDIFKRFCKKIENEDKARVWLTGLWGSGQAFTLAGLRERLRKPMLLVMPSLEEARRVYDQLRVLLEHPDPQREELFLFPSREVLPYEQVLTDMEIEGERLEVLFRLLQGENLFVVTAWEQIQEALPEPISLLERNIVLTKGQHVDLEKLITQLVSNGYVRESAVEARGQIAVRGGIIDIFPPAELYPWRIELEGSEIISLRRFNLGVERVATAKIINEAVITPAKVITYTTSDIETGFSKLERMRGKELVKSLRNKLDSDMQLSVLDNYFPYFLPLATIFDYFSSDLVVVVDSPANILVKDKELKQRSEQIYKERKAKELLLPEPDKIFYSFEKIGNYLKNYILIETGRIKKTGWSESEDLPQWHMVLKSTIPLRGNLELLIREAQALEKQGLACHIISHNQAEEEKLRRVLAERAANLDLPDFLGKFEFHIGHLNEGFQYPAGKLVVFTDQEIFNRHLGRPKPRRKQLTGYASQPVANVLELKIGELAVHRDHGIARYQGIVKLDLSGGGEEFICLAYAGEEKLYIPMDQLHLVERYIGGENAPRITRLGSSSWEKAKQRVKESVAELARQLLDTYANRQIRSAHAFSPDSTLQNEFEASFAYEETPDQLRAIQEVKQDMEASRPMNRLICGDVGFGKTEVAMRAAFKAVQDGYQVAVLVPTTILATQHFTTFSERMAAYPIRIEGITRFKQIAQQKKILQDLAQGKLDIIIGTHRLLAKDVNYARLGLFIIDEEHHFGVAQKEKIKKIKKTIDVLTLTATPIPRTLYLSLSGIHDISVIETPPLSRLAIRTYVLEYSEAVIKEAILRELARDGQIFFIHNRVHNIGHIAERIKKLVPSARVAIAHGKMTRQELEPVIERFLARAEDILVSTTIVESGLDMPNVNTIIINRADTLGMAQLYQLRGRVGRADRQAYAYLLYPIGGTVTNDAEKRLNTLQEFTELGSGIKIAMRDMEIRGTGDILGPDQSGQVAAVGFETYCSLLEEAIAEIRGQKSEQELEVKITIPLDAYLPTEYIPDNVARLNIYKQISGFKNKEKIMFLKEELENRYGFLPLPAKNLLEISSLKILARVANIIEIKAIANKIQFFWSEKFIAKNNSSIIEKIPDIPGRKITFIPGEKPGAEIVRKSKDLLEEIKILLSELNFAKV